MKFIIRILSLSFIFIILVGCQQNEGTSTLENDSAISDETMITSTEVRIGDFVYRLSTEKEEYNGDEPIIIHAKLEYVGDQEQIDISHAASPFYFPIKETTRNYDIPYVMEEPMTINGTVHFYVQ